MTKSYVFDPPPPSTVAIASASGRFPVRRSQKRSAPARTDNLQMEAGEG